MVAEVVGTGVGLGRGFVVVDVPDDGPLGPLVPDGDHPDVVGGKRGGVSSGE